MKFFSNISSSIIVNIFMNGMLDYSCFNIPSLIYTTNNNNSILVAFSEARKYSCNDIGYIDIVSRTSYDKGLTWTDISILTNKQRIYNYNTTYGDACPVFDNKNTIHMIYMVNNTYIKYVNKTINNDWSEPYDITRFIKINDTEQFIGSGHASGLFINNEKILFPIYFGGSAKVIILNIQQDDQHKWSVSNDIQGCGEGQIVKLNATHLFINMRNNNINVFPNYRYGSYSIDNGTTWSSKIQLDLHSPIDGCEGSTVSTNNNKLYFSGPNDLLLRTELYIYKNIDNFIKWKKYKKISEKASGYSSMVNLDNNKLGLLYTHSNDIKIIFNSKNISYTIIIL